MLAREYVRLYCAPAKGWFAANQQKFLTAINAQSCQSRAAIGHRNWPVCAVYLVTAWWPWLDIDVV